MSEAAFWPSFPAFCRSTSRERCLARGLNLTEADLSGEEKPGAAPALPYTVPILLSPLESLAEKDLRASRPPMEKERSALAALLERRRL